MENKVLPAVRIPTVHTGESTDSSSVVETPIVDLPPSEKFAFEWPDSSKSVGTPTAPPQIPEIENSDFETSEPELQLSKDSAHGTLEHDSADNATISESPTSSSATPVPLPSPPRLSRAFSLPPPSQLGHLNHPLRVSVLPPPPPLLNSVTPDTRFDELSIELADSVQMVIQTLLQISPPHLLDPAKEQFSACSLSIPSPSVSAILTALKNLNYMSANIKTFTQEDGFLPNLLSLECAYPSDQVLGDFDIGETLQSVGDALSGFAASLGVELVVFHGDVGMKHVSVRGDECGLSYALSHAIRQVIDTCQRGDTIEIGLSISSHTCESKDRWYQDSHDPDANNNSPSRAPLGIPGSAASLGFGSLLKCTFDIGHKFSISDHVASLEEGSPTTPGSTQLRAKPKLDTLCLHRLLKRINGSIREDLQPRLFSPGYSSELSVILEAGSPDILMCRSKLSPEEEAIRQPYANAHIQLATEPSIEELTQFVEQLKGKTVDLHSSTKGSFAHHLTSYLTTWGLDVSHTSSSLSEEECTPKGVKDTPVSKEQSFLTSPSIPMTESPMPTDTNPVEEHVRQTEKVESNPAFILIDDDLGALRSRLAQIRTESTFELQMRQRPKLATPHRPKSSPQITRAKGLKHSSSAQSQAPPHPVIIFFTSLSNYKMVKDLVYDTLSSVNTSARVPEIIVLPKPAGPRRVLTALRTAVIKPIVDPFFTPIATTPISPSGPGIHPFSTFFPSNNPSPSQKIIRPPLSPRAGSDRSSRSSKEAGSSGDMASRLPPSPLRESDSLEYFSETAVKLGASPSSGLVIQSPDGQPAGIFFHPRAATTKHRSESAGPGNLVNPPNLIRDMGDLRPPMERRRSNLVRHVTTQEELEPTVAPNEMRALGLGGPAAMGDKSHTNPGQASISPVSADASSLASSSNLLKWTESAHTRRDDSGQAGVHLTQTFTHTPPPPLSGSSQAGEAHSTITPPATAGAAKRQLTPPITPGSIRANGSVAPASRRTYPRRQVTEPSPVSPGSTDVKKGKPGADGSIVPPINVLIVEDNPINQTILSTFMKKRKIKYDVAKNGAEAVEKWKTGSFHLILMDIQMPIMDGIEATKEIRRLERIMGAGNFPSTPPFDGPQTPSDVPSLESKSSGSVQTPFRSSVIIVALTASSLQSDRVAALAAGCNDFLTKPVSLMWLNNKIIEWGSIKALQMYADLRPEVVKNISSGQEDQAKSVAKNLHVPEERKTRLLARTKYLGPEQMDALRKLSSPATKIPISRDLDAAESEFSDAEPRTVTTDTAGSTRTHSTPAHTAGGSPIGTPPEALPGEENQHVSDSQASTFKLGSREEALLEGLRRTMAEETRLTTEPFEEVGPHEHAGDKQVVMPTQSTQRTPSPEPKAVPPQLKDVSDPAYTPSSQDKEQELTAAGFVGGKVADATSAPVDTNEEDPPNTKDKEPGH